MSCSFIYARFTWSFNSLTVSIERLVNVIMILHSLVESTWANGIVTSSYLCIKGIALQLILALERPGVSLVHGQVILSSLEDLDFVHFLKFWPGEVALSCDCHICRQLLLSPSVTNLCIFHPKIFDEKIKDSKCFDPKDPNIERKEHRLQNTFIQKATRVSTYLTYLPPKNFPNALPKKITWPSSDFADRVSALFPLGLVHLVHHHLVIMLVMRMVIMVLMNHYHHQRLPPHPDTNL